jgi:hypothetical protein
MQRQIRPRQQALARDRQRLAAAATSRPSALPGLMKSLPGLVFGLAGCWQMTVYVGPRMDADGVVGLEVGASMGAAAPVGRGAIAASIDSSGLYRTNEAPDARVARKEQAVAPQQLNGMIRGVVEWSEAPAASDRFYRTSGIGWRAGVYGGVAFQEDRALRPLVGVQAAVSPLVWGLDDAWSKQFIALGVQLGTEAIPGADVFVMRAALTCDMQFLPRRW